MLETQADLLRQSKQREYRQLKLMLELIISYRKRVISLSDIVFGLERLFNYLEEHDEEWEIAFCNSHIIIDEECGSLCCYERHYFLPEEEKRVDDALSGLEKLIKERIKLYEPYLEDAEYQ